MNLLTYALCLSTVGAFTSPISQRTSIRTGNFPRPLHMADAPLAGLQEKVQQVMDKIKNSDGFNLDMDAIKANLVDGEFGTRGEAYTFAQLAATACVIVGGIPIFGDALFVLLGPGLLAAGSIVMFVSLTNLGESLSPWPVPPSDGRLETGGLYAEMRHPIYAGLLAAAVGLSIVTGSATRLLLTGLLWYILDIKVDFEEKELVAKFPEYLTYQMTVPSKFLPSTITKALPWGPSE